jgi:hypothetical protein
MSQSKIEMLLDQINSLPLSEKVKLRAMLDESWSGVLYF